VAQSLEVRARLRDLERLRESSGGISCSFVVGSDWNFSLMHLVVVRIGEQPGSGHRNCFLNLGV